MKDTLAYVDKHTSLDRERSQRSTAEKRKEAINALRGSSPEESEEPGQKLANASGMIVLEESSDSPLKEFHPEAKVASGPLTPAEKMRAYRERLKKDPKLWEAYKEANRLRMKRQRKRDV